MPETSQSLAEVKHFRLKVNAAILGAELTTQ